ncbi:MAG: NapC/NirT family cytochrome c [Burkholderiales bacterium]|nr:NapC/NirT family cytochrome c [Burkholderiales bacterium]
MSNGRSRFWSVLGTLIVGAVIGVAGVALTTEMVHQTSTVEFCGSACHSMQWVRDAYKRGPHYSNSVGVRAGCADCHIPHESGHANPFQYVGLMMYKAKAGIRDVIAEASGKMSTKEQWEKLRPELSNNYKTWMKENGSLTCRGCHDLKAFGGKDNEMKALVHADVIKAEKPDCLQCHEGVGHVYEEPKKAEAPAATASK